MGVSPVRIFIFFNEFFSDTRILAGPQRSSSASSSMPRCLDAFSSTSLMRYSGNKQNSLRRTSSILRFFLFCSLFLICVCSLSFAVLFFSRLLLDISAPWCLDAFYPTFRPSPCTDLLLTSFINPSLHNHINQIRHALVRTSPLHRTLEEKVNAICIVGNKLTE